MSAGWKRTSSRGKKGAWGYSENHGGGDNSNSQFALLALHEADRVGVPVDDRTWRRIQTYWQRIQNYDGSWGYTEQGVGPESGSMTLAGIAALVIAADKLNPGDAEVEGDRILCCGKQAQNDSVERGLAWLAQHFSVTTNPGTGNSQWLLYYLYGLDTRRPVDQSSLHRPSRLVPRRGHVSGQFPGRADRLLEGSGHAENNPHIGTSLALLFLSKGRRPVLISKLKHDPVDDWNHHRTDLHNLTALSEQRWKRN